MNWKLFNKKEKMLFLIRIIFGSISHPFVKIANWATVKLNKSYYRSYIK